MRKKTTIKELAHELGVSISTVSKALNDSPEISKDTIEKVKAFAKLLHYRPNNIALSLKNKRTKTIGIIIPEIVHHFFAKVIKGVELYANSKGYNVIVGLSNESFDKEVVNMEMLANGSIDGFVISISRETLQQQDYHHFNETINEGIPVVMFDRVVNEIECDKVIVDDMSGAKEAVEKLISNGCKQIGLITTKDYVSVGRLRSLGYMNALKTHGVIPNSELILKIDDDLVSEDHLDVLEDEITQLFKGNPTIDGVFAVNELYAVTAMKVARKLNINIPEQLQVIGFTDGVLSKHAWPSLSTVSQHGEEMGQQSAELLIRRIEASNESETDNYKTIIIPTKLIERKSTL